MEDNYQARINEDIRQYKLHKIQIVESKIKEYRDIFNTIKQTTVIKLTKNTSSNILRIIIILFMILLLVAGIWYLFPEQAIKMIEKSGEEISKQEKAELIKTMPYFGYGLISLLIPLGFTSWLLKKNIQKRNTIYNLSKLLNEVIGYMDNNVKEDKKKYEYFIDNLGEIQTKQK